MAWQDAASRIRGRVGASILERVAGPQGPAHHQVIFAEGGERWFAEDRPIRRVHGDSSMFVGGISALLLQSLHPLAMAAVAGHSGYKGTRGDGSSGPATVNFESPVESAPSPGNDHVTAQQAR